MNTLNKKIEDLGNGLELDKTNWIEGVKDKTTFEYFKNGKIKKEITDLGDYKLKIREFYNNGNIRKQYYIIRGRKYGETIYYDKNGILKDIC